MKRFAGIVACAVALAACLVVVGCAGETGSLDNAITVSAKATAQVVPDKATIGVMTTAEADSADKARAAGEAAAHRIVEALKEAGVAEEGVQAASIELDEQTSGVPGEIIDGYEDEWGNWIDVYADVTSTYVATVQVTASGFDADKLASVAHSAAQAGATGFVDLYFSVGDRNAAYQQALDAAVETAHEKAEALAKASGVYVGRLVNLVEGDAASFEATVKDDASVLDPNDESTLNVAPSKIPVEASVTASYAIS